jgi:hypothetical protein
MKIPFVRRIQRAKPNDHLVILFEADSLVVKPVVGRDRDCVIIPGALTADRELLRQQLTALARFSKRGLKNAVLLAPRSMVVHKQLSVPMCDDEILPDVVRSQLELRYCLGGEENDFDYVRRPTSAGVQDDHLTLGLFAARREDIALWTEELKGAGIILHRVSVATQVMVDAINDNGSGEPELLMFSSDTGYQMTLRAGRCVLADRHIGHSADSAPCIPALVADLTRFLASQTVASVPRSIRLLGEFPAEFAEAIAKRFTQIPLEIGTRNGEANWPALSRDGWARQALTTSFDLLRHRASGDAGVATRRTRIRWVAAASLLVLSGIWALDSRLRALDKAIFAKEQTAADNDLQLDRGLSIEETFQFLQNQDERRVDLLADFDRIVASLATDDRVFLTSIRATVPETAGAATIQFSCSAPDTTAVSRLLTTLAADPSNADVSPLGLRPKRGGEAELLECELQVTRARLGVEEIEGEQ